MTVSPTARLNQFCGLGFTDLNPNEKESNSLTETVFYTCDLMSQQSYRMEYEFEKECINQMARSTLRKYQARFNQAQTMKQKMKAAVMIGHGHTYTKYNTLMHFLNVTEVCSPKAPNQHTSLWCFVGAGALTLSSGGTRSATGRTRT